MDLSEIKGGLVYRVLGQLDLLHGETLKKQTNKQTKKKASASQEVVAHGFNLSTWETEAGRTL